MNNLKHRPLVSVLMTVYNREEYIAEAIESVLASTYRNWELIIVDDQSKDNSVAIARSYTEKDDRIRVYVNEVNLGDYPNRNKAASYANGKYLKYVDADDMIYPYGLEQLVFYMEQFPDAGYGFCSLEPDKDRIYPFELNPKAAYERHYMARKSIFHKAPLSSIIKRDVFEREGGFAAVRHYGDFELWHRLSKKHHVVLMPHGIVWYRENEGQEAAIRKENPVNALKTIQSAMAHIESGECPLQGKDQRVIIDLLNKRIASAILSTFRHRGWSKGMEMKGLSKMGFMEIINYKFFR